MTRSAGSPQLVAGAPADVTPGSAPTRVLHLLARLQPGGIETWLMSVFRAIDRRRFHFTFCLMGEPGGPFEDEAVELGGEILRCRWHKDPIRWGRRFRRALREGRYDVVHSHAANIAGYHAFLAARERIPARIMHLHTMGSSAQMSIPRRFYRRSMAQLGRRYATHLVGCARAPLHAFFGPNVTDDPRTRIVYYGVDTRRFTQPIDRAEVRRSLGLPVDAPLVLHVGRLSPPKNHRGLIRIARAIHERRGDVHFLLVGDGPLRSDIERWISEAGLTDHIHLAGLQMDVVPYLKAADLFLLPSIWEGLPVSLIEARAAGLRAVASDLPGIREANEVVTDATLLPPDAAPHEWADTILQRLAEPAPDPDAALAAVRESAMSASRSVENLARLYEDASVRRD